LAELIHITAAEREIMDALWRAGPLSPARLIEAVRQRRDWAEPTIKTLLGRLMQKKAVRSERDDGRLIYRPLVDRDTYVAAEVHALVDQLFDGDPARLAAFLAKSIG
jgi:BlaI family transcriptional regulator, penicillinase repressor